jgi:ADP-ribose pyrophosphatase YjhB (NUDIX family)
MLKKLLGTLWRRMPRGLRRFNVILLQDRFTATAAAVIVDERGRVLLLKHVFRVGSGWGIPGGFISSGEQPEEAVRREVREETGIEIEDLTLVFARTLKQYNQIEFYFRCRPVGTASPRSVEIKDAGWFSTAELPDELSLDQCELIERALKARA